MLTERYEALRARALSRSVGSERSGLALLLREGMAAWIAAWSSCWTPPTIAAAPAAPATALAPPTDSTAIVALLASMALYSLQQGQHS